MVGKLNTDAFINMATTASFTTERVTDQHRVY